MKQIRLLSIGLIVATLILSSCQDQQKASTEKLTKPQSITLRFETNPTTITPNQSVELKATVLSEKKPVNDAKVELEVWKEKDKKHQMLPTQRTGEGVYTTRTSFPQEGTYHVIVHATTPQVHQMINAQFQVGTNHHAHSTHSHQKQDQVTMHLSLPDTIQSGRETKLISHIQYQGKPLTGANVQLEIWPKNSHNHDFTDTAEINPGEYYTTYRFPQPGTYQVKIHVEKDSLHEHQEQTVEVK